MDRDARCSSAPLSSMGCPPAARWRRTGSDRRKARWADARIPEHAPLPAVLMQETRGVLDAATFRRAMSLFLDSLRKHRHELNSLNVYPVPDGDTGTNLLLTQEAVVGAVTGWTGDGEGFGPLGDLVSQASLMGARGNSGVILSQVLRGLLERMPRVGRASAKDLAGAFEHASDEAYQAVARPAEGTVLTVLRDSARAAMASADGEGSSDADVIEAA